MIRRVFIAAALAVLLAGLASAQRGGGGGGGRGGGGGMGGGGGFGRGPQLDKLQLLTDEFKLTADQKTQLTEIFDDAQKQTAAVVPQAKAAQDALLNLSLRGQDTAAAVQQLAVIRGQIMNISLDAYYKALAKLDDKQKAKASKLYPMLYNMYEAGNWRRTN